MTLPPQAYTRDILIKAYEWLRDQPSALQGKAQDADSLVALYMQSRRRTSQDSWEQKVTTETFKNDLRHLAEDLKQFETPAPVVAPSPPQRSILATTQEQHYTMPDSAPKPAPRAQMPTMHETPQPERQTSTTYVSGLQLDERSLKMAREIQNRFNLSSEMEAIRMLLVLGYEKARPLLD